ncbi:hypothetical protein [Flavobacterium sp.]|uniref:hypothetical protein n=1 Tax=Flavobacterium sp. TaxID=239 RepID=UPI00286DC716|nr:hypothetical protein [Flavobacterium sp.]
METIKIEFQSSVKEKLIEFLNSFSKNELHIVEEDKDFLETKKRLYESYQKLKNGETELYSFEELDALLEKTISKYES